MCGLLVRKGKEREKKLCLFVIIGSKKKMFSSEPDLFLGTDDQSLFWFLSLLLLLFFFPMWDRDVNAYPLILFYSSFADTPQEIF